MMKFTHCVPNAGVFGITSMPHVSSSIPEVVFLEWPSGGLYISRSSQVEIPPIPLGFESVTHVFWKCA